MNIRSRALRQALNTLPRQRAASVVRACGLTPDEERCILEELDGADTTWVSGAMSTSHRSVGRLRASALRKIGIEIGF